MGLAWGQGVFFHHVILGLLLKIFRGGEFNARENIDPVRKGTQLVLVFQIWKRRSFLFGQSITCFFACLAIKLVERLKLRSLIG